MAYDFSPLKKRLEEVKEWLSGEQRGIHTGRAAPGLLDSILVENYGAKTQISHVSSVTIEDARTLRVVPWDKGMIKPIEKAIASSDLGVNTSVDDSGVRVHFPELTGERRETVLKVLRGKLEEARVSVRNEREGVWNDIQKQEKEGEMTEDDKFLFKEELQNIVDETTKALEEMAEKKEKEIAS